jgi:hypothetical protein
VDALAVRSLAALRAREHKASFDCAQTHTSSVFPIGLQRRLRKKSPYLRRRNAPCTRRIYRSDNIPKRQDGHEILGVAASAEKAIQLLTSGECDAAVLDSNLGGCHRLGVVTSAIGGEPGIARMLPKGQMLTHSVVRRRGLVQSICVGL